MKATITYLNFDGNTREVMQFYQRCFGGDLMMQQFSDVNIEAPPEARNRIVHAKLTAGPCTLMASDTLPGMPLNKGNNFHICLNPESAEETEKVFNALAHNGNITMPLQDMFWGARFGMLVDQFGINWMLNYEKPKA